MRSIRNIFVSCSVIAALTISQPIVAATSYEAQPAPTEAQSVTWDRGVALFQSNQANSQLGVKFLQYDDAKLFFLVAFKNASSAPVDFGLEQIMLKDASGRLIKLYSRDELVRAIKQKRDAKKFFAILGATVGVLASVAASQETRTGTTRDSQGRTQTYMERHTNGAVLAAGSAASMGAGALVLRSANKNADAKIKYLNDNYLVRQTITPSGEVIGVIEAQMPKLTPKSATVDLIVNVAGDTHQMKFNVVKK